MKTKGKTANFQFSEIPLRKPSGERQWPRPSDPILLEEAN